MAVNCSICLNIFKEPVCLPCGHIYCSKCLSDHINAPTHKGMMASCPDCRTNFNLFTPEVACLPKQYHPFILPSLRRVYLDLSACSTIQKKLEQAEARLEVHKSHEEALVKRCESLSAALNAHRVGETKALLNLKELKMEMRAIVEDHQHTINEHIARYQKLDEQTSLLQAKYTKTKKLRCQEQNEEARPYELQPLPEKESRVTRSGPTGLTMELRAMKPLPKRRASGRTRSNSPPPIYVKRPRLSEDSCLRS